MPNEKKVNVERKENIITIYHMNHPRCVSNFINVVKDTIKLGYTEVIIVFSIGHEAIFPNACVPIVSTIEHLSQKNGIDFQFDIDSKDIVSRFHLQNPIPISTGRLDSISSPLNILFRFESFEEVFAFTQKCTQFLSQQTECEEGTLDGLSWCVNEVMDNVITHSNCSCGYVMAQHHKQSNRIAICVADSGMGILKSLKQTKHHPQKPIDSLTLAIQEGVGDGKGQGNGLYGLHQIIRSNEGTLTLTSSGASIMITKTGIEHKYDSVPYINYHEPGTVVDFQMNLNKKVDLQASFSTIGGYDSVDYEIEQMMDENDVVQYDVFEHCQGTGTRESGRLLRNDVKNTLKRAKRPICLDFSKVTTVSSSFIDEFISKLLLDFGIVKFTQFVKLINMNETVKFLCERSTYMRIFEEWSKREKTEGINK